MLKSAGSGSAELVDVKMINDGTTSVLAGTLRLDGGGTHMGTFLISGGATLELGDGSLGEPHVMTTGATSAVVSGAASSTLYITGQTTFEAGTSADLGKLQVESFLDISGDVQAEYERLNAAGVSFRQPPTPMGPTTLAQFDDTCGNWIQLFQE